MAQLAITLATLLQYPGTVFSSGPTVKMRSMFIIMMDLCGWNIRSTDFIKNTIEAISDFSHKSCSIVVIHDDLSEIIEANGELQDLIRKGVVHYIKGKTRDTQTLEMANIHEASSIVLLVS